MTNWNQKIRKNPRTNRQSARKKRKETKKKDDRLNKKPKTTYTANCYECGQLTEITFKPDGVRPIYCQNCFQKIRQQAMRGETPVPDLAEVASPETPEVSLETALQMAPVDFEGKKSDSVKSPEPKNQEKISSPSIKTVKPGEVVKL